MFNLLGFLKIHPLFSLSAIALILSVFGLFPLIGIPGALVYLKWRYLLVACGLENLLPPLEGDMAWPCAVIVAILWPWFLPLGAITSKYWGSLTRVWSVYIGWMIASYLIWTLLVCFVGFRISK